MKCVIRSQWDDADTLNHTCQLLGPAPTRRVQQASVCSCEPALTLPQRPLEASGQSGPIAIDQWVSGLTEIRGHDLSVANSVEHDAPDVKHANHRSRGQLL